jgi:hypothetical protein
MFMYTPNPEVLREMEVPKTGKWWDKEFFKRKEILKSYGASQEYSMTVVLSQHFKNVKFFSEVKCKEIPVRGLLFPVSMFVEAEI